MTENLPLGEILKTWRWRIAKADKKEYVAAQESGLSRGQLSDYLNGKVVPTITKFEQFENYLRSLGV